MFALAISFTRLRTSGTRPSRRCRFLSFRSALEGLVVLFYWVRILQNTQISAIPSCHNTTSSRRLKLRYVHFTKGVNCHSVVFEWLFKGFATYNISLCCSTDSEYDLLVSSVFGPIDQSYFEHRSKFFMLFSMENFDRRRNYEEVFLNSQLPPNVAVVSHEPSLGRPRVYRVPNWYISRDFWKFNGVDIRYVRENIRASNFVHRTRQVALINSHAKQGGIWMGNARRLGMHALLSANISVDRPGKFARNMPTLASLNLTKAEFLMDYYFNLCPENSYREGYVTEKLFDSVFSGCIPIYWGNSNPENAILNNKRIIYFEPTENGSLAMANRIKYLLEDPKQLQKLWEQPIFLPSATKEITKYDQILLDIVKQVFTCVGID